MAFGVHSINVSQMPLKDMEGECISLQHNGITAYLPLLLEIEEGTCGDSLKLLPQHISVALG